MSDYLLLETGSKLILENGSGDLLLESGIAFDAASNSGYQAAQSTYSWSHTCTGSDRFLAVDISMLSDGQTVTGITYNGVALSLIRAQSTVTSVGRVECWGLVNPASGSNTIAVTLSGSIASAGTAVSYSGVHQTSPTEAANSAQATNVGAADATVSITTVAANDWVHGAVATDDASVTAVQTTRNNVSGAGGSGANEDTGPVATPGATTISYTGVGALATWAIAAYGIRPVGASGSTFNETGTGGAVTSGAATVAAAFNPAVSGGAASSGSATVQGIYNPSPSGGASGAGSATVAAVFNPSVSGGASGSGSATAQASYVIAASGGAASSGSAAAQASYVVSPSGGASSGGSGTVGGSLNPGISGGAVLSGSATRAYIAAPSPSGGVVLSGSGTISGQTFTETMSGGVVLSGSANVSKSRLNPRAIRLGPSIDLALSGEITIVLDTEGVASP